MAEQMTMGIEDMHEGIAEASDKGKPTLRRILATHEAVLDGVRKAQGWDRPLTSLPQHTTPSGALHERT
ncbi:hypothetical protein ACFQU7_38785 [Pseudoroseomonas wenyumeiae]